MQRTALNRAPYRGRTRCGEARSGFTILELMIAMAIMAVVTSQILGVFSNQLQTQLTQRRVLDVQADAQLVADMLRRDVRMAGFMLPTITGISTFDGGVDDADTLCISTVDSIDETNLDNATGRFDGAPLSAAAGTGGTVSLVAARMDLDGDGMVDFIKDEGIILAQGTVTHCARITAVSAGSVSFLPLPPGGFTLPIGATAVPAILYELTNSGLARNGVLLSSDVEDLQVEFGVDANDDGQIGGGEFPKNDLNGQNPSLVRTVRLSVLTRTAREDSEMMGHRRQAIANRDPASAGDSFRRRLVRITAAPRNLFWGS